MFRQRLLWQFSLAYTAIGVAAMLLASWYAAYTARNLYLDEVSAELERGARAAGDRLLAGGEAAPSPAVEARAKELGQLLGMRITLVAPDGQVRAESAEDPQQMDNHAHRPEIAAALGGSVGGATRYSDTLQEERRYVAVPIYRGGKLAAVVRTSVPVRTLAHTLYAVYARIALAGVAVTVAVALVSLWASRRILRPLERIREGAERLARGELGHRLRVADPVEIALLAETLNQMARQLNERIDTILRQQNEQEAILSSMEEGVLAVDASGTIIKLNQAGARMLGVDAAAVRGRTVHEAVRRAELLQFVERALAGDGPLDADLQFAGHPDRWFAAHGTALYDADRRKIGALVVLDDVTLLRHLEHVRRDFVANVSHELKTPITSIKGFVETLADESLEDRDRALRFLGIILRQINRLDSLIEDLLSLSRIERGEEWRTIPLEPAPLGQVLASALELCARKAADKQVTVAVRCPEDLAAPINVPLLEQAIVNLVDNAVKYSAAGATVEVEAERDAAGIVIRVKDQGCGIAPQHLGRLFERFYRVDKARSRELGGTGLGLAIVKHIVSAHHGSVDVESAVGKGSTFSIRLPAPAAEPALPESPGDSTLRQPQNGR